MSELFLSLIILLLGRRDKKSLLRHMASWEGGSWWLVIEQWNFVLLKALEIPQVTQTRNVTIGLHNVQNIRICMGEKLLFL